MQPLTIGDFRTGLFNAREPWLAPDDAFAKLENAIPFRGRLISRPGYELFSKLGTYAVEVHGNGDGTPGPYAGSVPNTPVLPAEASPSTYTVKVVHVDSLSVDQQTLVDDGAGVLSGDGSGTFDYATGAYSATFNANVPVSDTIEIRYEYERGLPVMSVGAFDLRDGSKLLQATDTRRWWRWNSTTKRFDDTEQADVWSGDVEDQFSLAAFGDYVAIANGVDEIQYWDGSSIQTVDTDWSGGGNDLDSARVLVAYKSRILALSTVENGSTFLARARWTIVNPDLSASGQWLAVDFADAPIADEIVSAGFVGELLVVVFRQGFMALEATPDFRAPFRWRRITGRQDGGVSPRCVVEVPNRRPTRGAAGPSGPTILSLGEQGLGVTDGAEAADAIVQVPDFIDETNPSAMNRVASANLLANRQCWWCYPSVGEDQPTHVLAYQKEDGAWAMFSGLSFASFGDFRVESGLLWGDLVGTLADQAFPWDRRDFKAGFPIVLAGDHANQVHKVGQVFSDAGSAVTAVARSKRFNPFRDQGADATLVHFDIQCDAVDVVLTVRFYRNQNPVAYGQFQVNMNSDRPKTRRRIVLNATGDDHEFELQFSTTRLVSIDFVRLWFTADQPMDAAS